MRNHIPTFSILTIGLMLSSSAVSAGQIDQLTRVAVSLLRSSIACPLPMQSWIGRAQRGRFWQKNILMVSRYLGSDTRFREFIRTESINPRLPAARIETGTKIIDFNYADINVRQQGEWVTFMCKSENRCIKETLRTGPSAQQKELESYTLFSCDAATAENIRKATDVLAAHTGNPQLPQGGAPI